MVSWIWTVAALFAGSALGFMIAAVLLSNKVDKAYSKGYNRGKIVSANSIK